MLIYAFVITFILGGISAVSALFFLLIKLDERDQKRKQAVMHPAFKSLDETADEIIRNFNLS